MTYIPTYLPSSESGNKPDFVEFATEGEAWDYIFSQMCSTCRDERRRALEGVENEQDVKWQIPPSLYPACACEWTVQTREEYDESEEYGRFLESFGDKPVLGNSSGCKYFDCCPACGDGIVFLYREDRNSQFRLGCDRCDFQDDVAPV